MPATRHLPTAVRHLVVMLAVVTVGACGASPPEPTVASPPSPTATSTATPRAASSAGSIADTPSIVLRSPPGVRVRLGADRGGGATTSGPAATTLVGRGAGTRHRRRPHPHGGRRPGRGRHGRWRLAHAGGIVADAGRIDAGASLLRWPWASGPRRHGDPRALRADGVRFRAPRGIVVHPRGVRGPGGWPDPRLARGRAPGGDRRPGGRGSGHRGAGPSPLGWRRACWP